MTAKDFYRNRKGWVAPKLPPAEPEPPTSVPEPERDDAGGDPRPAGLHRDVPEEEYHADRSSLSQSGAKLLLRAPALYRHQLDHREFTKAYDLGHAAHQLVLGVGMPLVVVDADSWRTKAARAARDEARANDRVPLLPAEHERVQRMADALAANQAAMALLGAGEPEVSAYAPDEETGVMRRARFDWLTPGILVDLKTANTAHPQAFARDAAKFGYDLQVAWYLDVATACGWDARAFAFVVVETDPPYLTSVVEWDADSIEVGRRKARRALDLFAHCTATDTWPGYQEPGAITQIRLPAWHFTEETP